MEVAFSPKWLSVPQRLKLLSTIYCCNVSMHVMDATPGQKSKVVNQADPDDFLLSNAGSKTSGIR